MMNDIETPFLSDDVETPFLSEERDQICLKRNMQVCKYILFFFTVVLFILAVLEIYGVSNEFVGLMSKVSVIITLSVLIIFLVFFNVSKPPHLDLMK